MAKVKPWRLNDGKLYQVLNVRAGYTSAWSAAYEQRHVGYETTVVYNGKIHKYEVLGRMFEG